jgi:hypothetical protein
MRTLRNLTGLMFGFVIGVVLTLSLIPIAHSTDLASDAPLPKAAPIGAIITLCKNQVVDGKNVVIYILVGYANGDTLVIDGHHFHGLLDAEAVFNYVKTIPATQVREIDCPKHDIQS